jgi:hypothetical protein
VTHFVSGTKSLRQTPFIIIKKGNTFEVGPTMCVSIANERKTQVEWVVVVAQRVRKWANANNIPPKGPPCCVLDLDEMTAKSPCLEAFEKYNGNVHA